MPFPSHVVTDGAPVEVVEAFSLPGPTCLGYTDTAELEKETCAISLWCWVLGDVPFGIYIHRHIDDGWMDRWTDRFIRLMMLN